MLRFLDGVLLLSAAKFIFGADIHLWCAKSTESQLKFYIISGLRCSRLINILRGHCYHTCTNHPGQVAKLIGKCPMCGCLLTHLWEGGKSIIGLPPPHSNTHHYWGIHVHVLDICICLYMYMYMYVYVCFKCNY